MADEDPAVDPLFLGMTRPAMVLGVTYTFFIINVCLTAVVFISSGNLWFLLLCVPLHAAGYLICLKDPRMFDLWRIKMTKTMRCRNRRFWKANSYAP